MKTVHKENEAKKNKVPKCLLRSICVLGTLSPPLQLGSRNQSAAPLAHDCKGCLWKNRINGPGKMA